MEEQRQQKTVEKERGQKGVVNHFAAGSNCQVFNGAISGCVFAMPGSSVTQVADKAAAGHKEEKAKAGATVPDVLASEEAQKYWERLQKAGFTDAEHQLCSGVSRKQAMYIALAFSEKLNLASKWKPFEQLWNKRNLAQEKWNMTETGIMPSRYEEIDELFKG